MKAVSQDHVIAESDRTIELDGYRYFPQAAVQYFAEISPLNPLKGRETAR
jgi:hypothetical protein